MGRGRAAAGSKVRQPERFLFLPVRLFLLFLYFPIYLLYDKNISGKQEEMGDGGSLNDRTESGDLETGRIFLCRCI